MTNREAYSLAEKYIPAGVSSPVRAFSNVESHPIMIEKAQGAYLYDVEGKRYLDFVQSWGPLIFGHCDKDIEKALIQAAQKGLSFGLSCPDETRLAKLIVDDFDFLDKIRFVNSGTEATMSAIRLARGFTKRNKIIKFEGNYHGHSDALLVKAGSGVATFGTSSSSGVPEATVQDTFVAKYNDIASVKEIFAKHDDIACIIIEAVAGNMGLVPAKKEFLQELRELCDKNSTLLILDEVMSGYRASKLGSYGIFGVKADIVTFGKVIGGGMNAAAFAARNEIMNCISPLGSVYQAGTLSGNPLAMAAGCACLNKINEFPDLYEKLNEKAELFLDGLKSACKKNNFPIVTKSLGSMFGYFFTNKEVFSYEDALQSDLQLFSKFHAGMLQEGIYLAQSQFETGFICEAMREEDITFAIDAAYKVLGKI